MKPNLHVTIIGGGLGGLCLAQGLKKAGIGFTVFERDEDASARIQGYRLSITADGFEAIYKNLPTKLWQRVEEATDPLKDGMSLVTEQLDELMFIKAPAPESEVRRFGSISRVALREILLADLGDDVQFGKRFSRYELLPDQSVRAFFEDGAVADGQLLVGCDGVNSKVQPQFQPSAGREDTGVCAISGKIPFQGASLADFLSASVGESAVIIDKQPQGMFLGKHQLEEDQGSYLFWSFGGPRERFPANLDALPPDGLIQLAQQMTNGWHPRLHAMIGKADPATVRVLRFRASKRVAPWRPSTVTLLGDAIHSMPPSGGLGANTALRDASALCEALINNSRGHGTLVEAVGDYEKRMFEYAFPAIDESMNNLRRMTRANLFARRAGRIGAKVAGTLLGMKRPKHVAH
ncbi:MAG: NAD(P)/FAD-dependent oxidoreductase [Pseudomonadota bacterium]